MIRLLLLLIIILVGGSICFLLSKSGIESNLISWFIGSLATLLAIRLIV